MKYAISKDNILLQSISGYFDAQKFYNYNGYYLETGTFVRIISITCRNPIIAKSSLDLDLLNAIAYPQEITVSFTALNGVFSNCNIVTTIFGKIEDYFEEITDDRAMKVLF